MYIILCVDCQIIEMTLFLLLAGFFCFPRAPSFWGQHDLQPHFSWPLVSISSFCLVLNIFAGKFVLQIEEVVNLWAGAVEV